MDQPRTYFAHILSARGVAVLVTNHQVQPLPVRPREGNRTSGIVCSACGEQFLVTVDSCARTTALRVRYFIVGLVLLALSAFLLWLTFSVGMQPDGPDLDLDPDNASWLGYTGVTGFLLPIFGLGLLLHSRRYDGVGKLRRIGADGRPSKLVAGHKLLPNK
ncbi:hypothetical protein [Streptomyces liangshanensis]|uniref:hypothetical protein n=1 Tax=Streptomyces liangshanensis TaxID=2717324 RepID=UPI0036D9833F